VFNKAGFSDSEVLQVILAAEPDQPLVSPFADASRTNEHQIMVRFNAFSASQNGGSPITSYELQVDNGFGGDFTPLIGFEEDSLETEFLFTENLHQSDYFRFRYRAKNVNGWGPFSPIAHLKAATVPQRPPKPAFVTADSTSVSLRLFESEHDGGQLIEKYELYVNIGGASPSFNKVESYDGFASELSVGSPDVTPGQIYKFIYRAYNSYGYSDFSEELNAAVGSFPAKNNPVRRVRATTHSLTLEWDQSAATELPVLGYRLNMNDGLGGSEMKPVFNSVPANVLSFTVSNLQTAREYLFTVEAFNYNGYDGVQSDAIGFIVCVEPSGLNKAKWTSISRTTITLEWTAPDNDGGCPVTSYSIYR
jgi:hypothetical protein